jgi:cytochrome c-type biogenesis protein CcsB
VAGINGSMAHLSDTFFTTAIAAYALAAVSYTAEYAFGRKGRIAATVPAESRVLVGAGGPSVSSTPPTDAKPTRRTFADRAGRAGVAITVFGLVLHAVSIAIRGLAVDAVPWSNMYEFASVAGAVGVLAFLAVLWKLPSIRHLGGFVLLPVVLLMFLAGTVLYSKAQPLVPALQSYWLGIHVTLVSIAEGALMTSAVLTVLFLVKQRHTRLAGSPDYRPGSLGNLAARLPSAATLDTAAYRIVAFAFPLYTVAIICGAIWAEAAWGRYWGWDPKETWSFISWVAYAAYLHARATPSVKRTTATWFAVAAWGTMLINLYVINFVAVGLHSYAGVK